VKYRFKGKKVSVNNELLLFLKNTIEPGSSILDLGCGPKAYSNVFKDTGSKILTVDAWDNVEPDVLANLEEDDIIEIVKNQKYDYILMLDFIEHLSKEKGLSLIENCKKITNKKIFLLTPLEEIWTDNHENIENEKFWCYGNQYDIHKSMWTKDEFINWTEVPMTSLKHYYFGYFSNAS
jgi:2-polyprenyl-3-methyl-5-hydroxy-6-metoxy-1,4-benzoquinol methylase